MTVFAAIGLGLLKEKEEAKALKLVFPVDSSQRGRCSFNDVHQPKNKVCVRQRC